MVLSLPDKSRLGLSSGPGRINRLLVAQPTPVSRPEQYPPRCGVETRAFGMIQRGR